MKNPEGTESPLITAIRLARMRDGNMGQAEEIQALFDILKGSEKLLNIVNDTVWSMITKKQGMSQIDKRITFEESYTILKDALERFVTAKIERIEKFIRYFQIFKQDVTEESKKLKEFEKEYENVQRKLDELDIDYLLNLPKNDSYIQTNLFKENVLQISLPIAQKLTDLENQMQKRVISMIAFIATANQPVNSNELYKLLTGEP